LPLKILQNQRVVTPPYCSYVTYLYDKLPTFLPVLLRRIPYREVFEGAIQFLLSKKYDAVVTVGHRPAIVFAILNRIARAKRKQVVKELFIDEEGLSSKFTTRLYRWGFRNLSLVITNSSGEIPYMMNWLQLPIERFRFLAWPSNISVQEILPTPSDYILACGRSSRDWETLFEAVQGMNVKCVIVASKRDFANIKLPKNLGVYFDIPHSRYLSLLQKSKIVVIPLKKTFRSIGQAAILEAMAFGKPVITAKVTGIMDYIQPGINGLFYEPGEAGSLRDAILRLLEDNGLQRKLGEAARQSIENFFNKDNYSKRMLETMAEVCLHG
jgi:glycosyltransferase involved in cell wall biosynthesis